MSTIKENFESILEEFGELEDGFERYSYLVELASFLPDYPEEYRDDAHLIKGCQSHVWIHKYLEDGLFKFHADSDTLIIKGLLLVLSDILNAQPPIDVANTKLNLLVDLGVQNEFSSDRQKGITSIIQDLKTTALTMVEH